MCADLTAEIASLTNKGVECTEVQETRRLSITDPITSVTVRSNNVTMALQ
jgi:hypothetical protein